MRGVGWGQSSPPLFAAASPAHFLSPPNPTTPTRTRAHTLPGGPAASLRAQRSRPRAWGERRSALLLFKSHPRRAPWPQALRPGESIPSDPGAPHRHGHRRGGPGARSRIRDSPAPGAPPCRASPAPGARCGSAPRPRPLPPPLPLPFLSPDQSRSCRRRRRLPRSAGAPPAALPAAWHHPGSISREQRSGPAGSPGAGGAPAASVMDVNKMVSQEPGPLPWSLGVPVPPPSFPRSLPVGWIH